MKNLLPIIAMLFTPAFSPALAADGTSDASEEEESLDKKVQNLTTLVQTLTTNVGNLRSDVRTLSTTLGKPNSNTGCSAANPCGLWGRLENLTTKVDTFAGRGHQVAVVMTIPTTQRLGAAYLPDYYLVGTSTIPGFPRETVAATGKFAQHSVHLPAGTYLFELQQPYSDQPFCQSSISRLHVTGSLGGGDRTGCPRINIFPTNGGVSGGRQRMEDGFLIYTVTTTTGSFQVKHRFPAPHTFAFTEERPLNSYRGAVKITRLK